RPARSRHRARCRSDAASAPGARYRSRGPSACSRRLTGRREGTADRNGTLKPAPFECLDIGAAVEDATAQLQKRGTLVRVAPALQRAVGYPPASRQLLLVQAMLLQHRCLLSFVVEESVPDRTVGCRQ